MGLLFGRKRKIPTPTPPSTSTDAIGSDRLRKAIERNRTKQMKRDNLASARPASNFSNPSDFARPVPARENPYNRESDKFARPMPSSENPYDRESERFARPMPPSGYQRPMSSTGMRARPPTPMGTRPGPSTLNRPPVSRPLPGSTTTTPTRPLTTANYSTPSSKAPSKWAKYFLRGLWIFSIFLLLRLVFTERGVVEYYGRKGNLEDKFERLGSIRKANVGLIEEIKKIRKDSAYQKSLVRNHLGFIARDEFIVLLPD
ncbi:MAG: hypothetical protein E2O68_00880 [Deltaproteobacteria bacterium]|nr:MAG: hypothetical protein E2O68_00880 [Deltaproteobacteria bacterium]